MADYHNKVAKTLRHLAHRFQVSARGLWWDLLQPVPVAPVFVVGCSRAGTTLVYKTFSESGELGSLQKETHDFWSSLHSPAARNWSSHALSASDVSERDHASVARYFFTQTGKRRFVDKNNQSGLSIPYLHALFPDASFVYVKRNPGDNINSLMEGWRRPDQFATWSRDLPANVNIDHGEITRWCFFLPEGWQDYLNSPLEEVCAFQYNAINSAIMSAKSRVPANQWTDIAYEDIILDPVNGFRQAFEDCGITFTRELQEHCSSVLNKPYNAFSEIKLGKWRQGANQMRIERVLPATIEVAMRMGYSI